jgi:hypothetical protein
MQSSGSIMWVSLAGFRSVAVRRFLSRLGGGTFSRLRSHITRPSTRKQLRRNRLPVLWRAQISSPWGRIRCWGEMVEHVHGNVVRSFSSEMLKSLIGRAKRNKNFGVLWAFRKRQEICSTILPHQRKNRSLLLLWRRLVVIVHFPWPIYRP